VGLHAARFPQLVRIEPGLSFVLCLLGLFQETRVECLFICGHRKGKRAKYSGSVFVPRCPTSTKLRSRSSSLMTKPTLVQSLLNRPSQTYSGPNVPRKEYYSTKQEMLRIAAEEAAKRPSGERPRVVEVGIIPLFVGPISNTWCAARVPTRTAKGGRVRLGY